MVIAIVFSCLLSTIAILIAILKPCSCNTGAQPNLAAVAISGKYSDLIDRPDLKEVALTGQYNALFGKPQLAAVAISGVYSDLNAKPNLVTVGFSGNYDELIGKPNLSRVAMSGNYNDLQGIPQLHTVALNGNYNDLNGKPLFSQVATTGNYNDLQNRPSAGFSGKYDDLIGKPIFSRVASTGNYSDLIGIPQPVSFSPVALSGNYNDLIGKPSLSKVATTGNYGDLQNTPTWVGFSGKYDDLIGAPILAKVALTGNYSDLLSAPTNKSSTIVVFTNWGRTTCPRASNRLVYVGHAAGSHYSQGGGADYLCLPRDPEYSPNFTSTADTWAAHLYGVEMDIPSFPPLASFYNKEVLCAVCEEEAKAVLIIYAKLTCPTGYTKQYTGWAVAGLVNEASKQWICLNVDVESYGSGASDDQSTVYIVDTQCGSLPCGPFIPNADVSCVVCTRN